MKTGKGKGMSYHGGKARVGKTLKSLAVHCKEPKDVQTMSESSKNMGMSYTSHGMSSGK